MFGPGIFFQDREQFYNFAPFLWLYKFKSILAMIKLEIFPSWKWKLEITSEILVLKTV